MSISSVGSLLSGGASLAPLRAANEQPHLALELIQKVVQGMQDVGGGASMQTPVQTVSPSPLVGQNIDIYG